MPMTKTDRAELKSLLRARFKVLRTDVHTRAVELRAELRERVTDRFAGFDKDWDDAVELIAEVARKANREANDIVRKVYPDAPTDTDYRIVETNRINRPDSGRHKMLTEGLSRIDERVAQALQQLASQEVDLLTQLTVGALESDEARAFFNEIPTVAALVPTERLLALTGQLNDPEDKR